MRQKGAVRAGNYIFFYEKGKEKLSIENRILVYHRIVSVLKRVELLRDRMSYIDMRSRWSNIIVSNMHAPNEKKSHDLKDSFYEELEEFSAIFLSTV